MKEEAFLQEIESLPLFTAIHLIESQLLKADSQLGTDSLPKHEKIQLTVSQRLGYEANELTNVTPNGPNKKFVLQTNLIGLTGEQGVLPNHYSEWVIQRVRDNDTAMRDFFDIFNHRLLSLYYRCWQSYQLSAQLRLMSSTQSSPIQTVLSSLTGHLGDEAIFWGGIFTSKRRSRAFIKNAIEFHTGCDARLHEFKGRWFDISAEEQTRLCGQGMPEGQHAQLGLGAMLGQRSWNMSAGFEVELIARDPDSLATLLHTGRLNDAKQQIQRMLGTSKRIRWTLTARRSQLPCAHLAKGTGRLGKGSVLMPSLSNANKQITINI